MTREPEYYVEDFVELPAAKALKIIEDQIWDERPIVSFCKEFWRTWGRYYDELTLALFPTEIAKRTIALFCYENPEWLDGMVEQTNDAIDAWDDWVNEQIREGRWDDDPGIDIDAYLADTDFSDERPCGGPLGFDMV